MQASGDISLIITQHLIWWKGMQHIFHFPQPPLTHEKNENKGEKIQ